MTLKILHKRSVDVTGDISDAPLATDLEYGEIAINYADVDPALFIRDSTDVVRRLKIDGTPNKKYSVANDDTGLVGGDATTAINAALVANGDITAVGDLGISDQCEITDSGNPDFNADVPVGQYLWDGTVWFVGGGGANVTIAAIAPTNGREGDLWWNSTEERLYVYYDDGVTPEWVVATPTIGDAPADGKTYGRKDAAWEEITGGGGGGSATIGAIVAWANLSVPDGWLECDGSPIPAEYTELIALIGANTPDLRGEFVRGWDNGAGVDAGRALLSSQTDEFASHNHSLLSFFNQGNFAAGGVGNPLYRDTNDESVSTEGGTETRPRNVALMYIINADGSDIGGGGGTIINYNGASAWGDVAANGTLNGGLNVASVTRTAPGVYTVVFTTPMPSSTYSVTLGGAAASIYNFNITANGFEVNTKNFSDVNTDYPFSFTVFATNALPPKGTTGTDAWGSCEGDGTINASYNVASVTRTAAGQYDVVFTTPMPSSNYAVTLGGESTKNQFLNQTATGFTIYTYSTSDVRSDRMITFAVNATNAQLPNTVTQEQIESAINNPGCSAWGEVEGSTGNLLAGLNVASVTALGDGFRVTFATPMPSANYSITSTPKAGPNSSFNYAVEIVNQTANDFQVYLRRADGAAGANPGFDFAVFATNALPPKGGTGTDAWGACQADGTLDASFNVASVTRTGVGTYDVVFTTPMPTAQYSITGAVTRESMGCVNFYAFSTTGFSVNTWFVNNNLRQSSDYPFAFQVNATNATLPSTVTDAQAQQFLAFISSGGLPPVAYLTDERPSGTAPGGGSGNTWHERTLNTKEDPSNLVTLSNNQFTLAPGTYDIEWSAAGYRCDGHKARLINVTDGLTQDVGDSRWSISNASSAVTHSEGYTRVSITSDTTYKIEHFIQVSGTESFGKPSNSGEPEIYAKVKITGTPSA